MDAAPKDSKMTQYQISNTVSGADLGTYEADSEIGAHAAMLEDAGYSVSVKGGEIVFADAEAESICGDLSVIEITEAG